ncbi:unnamed protein product [Lepeophtheirus salmonis]|uniref:(salmon louse) hypothetical protein n=1 Tax=Lepeophtheirus salmonis TaxID=72036 RepID=A0A7R8CAE6_LEPSM|nr:unnamed protein product [Lepeophtheirus salmonis]CAF2750275.1 unnamed protein product [Lepeophtheirus salmonis]
MRYYISLSIQCLFFTTILIELSTVKAKNQCINHHGDSGFLLTSRDLSTPESKSQTKIKNIAKFRVKKSSNTGRLIVPSCGIRNERDRQVIGGQAVTDSMRHPWMVSLWQRNITTNQFADSFPICGAGIITDRHVITAAHCIMNSPDAQNDLFLLGGSTINEIPLSYRRTRKVIMRIKKITIHPSFDFLKLENDIAIITLETPIKFRLDLSPICLPDPGDEVIKDYVTVSGWGCLTEKCEASEAPSSLRETILPVIPNKIAMCWFMSDSKRKGREEYIPNTLFLVGGDISGLKSTCRGDSGSPVTRPRPSDGRIEVVGLVSWSKGCGRKFRPSIRIHLLYSWINHSSDYRFMSSTSYLETLMDSDQNGQRYFDFTHKAVQKEQLNATPKEFELYPLKLHQVPQHFRVNKGKMKIRTVGLYEVKRIKNLMLNSVLSTIIYLYWFFSKCYNLRPKWCILVGSSGSYSVCVCTYHQNANLLANAAKIEQTVLILPK